MDLAVGVIIGAAFSKIITSLVDDIIMPPFGYILGGIDFSKKKLVIIPEDITAKVTEVAIRYGNFINVVIQFMIIALCIFAVIKMVNKLKRKEAAAPETPHVPTKEEALLADIRDILRSQSKV